MLLNVHVFSLLLEDVQQAVVVRLGPHAVDDWKRKLTLLWGGGGVEQRKIDVDNGSATARNRQGTRNFNSAITPR